MTAIKKKAPRRKARPVFDLKKDIAGTWLVIQDEQGHTEVVALLGPEKQSTIDMITRAVS